MTDGPELPTRTLLLLRHAKSSWAEELPDHARPLGARGRRDSRAAGQALLGAGHTPDLVCCSTAVRARQTWDGVAEAGVRAGEVRYADSIYEASVHRLVALVRSCPPVVGTLLLIGHAPGLPGLAEQLAGNTSDADARQRVESDYPTCGLAVFQVASAWADLDAGARLTTFKVPRG